MSRYIPDLINSKIQRKHLLDPLLNQKQKDHPYKIAQEELEKRKEERANRIKYNCSVLKASRPKEWKELEEDLNDIYDYLRVANRRSPQDFIGINVDKGVSIDGQYWGLVKAHTDGQLKMLDWMFETFPITIEDVKLMDNPPAPIPQKKSFFKKVLQFFKDLVKSDLEH